MLTSATRERFEFRPMPVPAWESDDFPDDPPTTWRSISDRRAPDLLADLHVYAAVGAVKFPA
jgi:hypothetical protein